MRAENAVDWFVDRHARERSGSRAAFVDAERTLTYAGLLDETAAFARGLAAAGVLREHRVALLLQDGCAFPVAFWGALRAGVVPVPVNTLLPPALAAHILDDSRAAMAFVSAALLPALADVFAARLGLRVVVAGGAGDGFAAFCRPGPFTPVPASADETAFWLYSSGSTAAPKGVRHVHGSLRATVDTYGTHILGMAADDVVFSAAKLFFAYGLGNAMTFPMAVGACAVLHPERPTPDAVLSIMRRHRPTVFCGVPTLYAALLAHPDLGRGAGSDRLRRCLSAGEALPAAVGLAWRDRVGVDILDGIGSTEMLHIFLSNTADDVRYGTSGRAVPGYALRVVDEAGADVPDDAPGELVVHGPSAAEGYWNQRARTRHTFRGDWTWTGDKYVRQADGYYRYLGRTDDMFKVSGIWVSPFEVEGALVSHAAVQEAAVVGHAEGGLVKPRAFVVLAPGFSPSDALAADLQRHVKATAGPWKYPRWVEFLDELPKTATGKVQRFRLRTP